MVLEIGTDSGEVLDHLDTEPSELGGGADTAQFQKLRGVIHAGGDDDFLAGLGSAAHSSTGSLGQRGSFVEVLSIEEFHSCGARRTHRLIEEDLCDVAVGTDVQGVLLASIRVLRITNGDHELARAGSFATVGREGDLIETGSCISQLTVGVRITSNQRGDVVDGTSYVAQGEASACQEREKLGILGNDYSWLVVESLGSTCIVDWDGRT